MEERKSFTFFRSYYDAMHAITDEQIDDITSENN